MITLDGSAHFDPVPADPARTLRLIVDMTDEIRRLRSERDAARKEADAKGYRLDAAIDERNAVIAERNAAEADTRQLRCLIADYADSYYSMLCDDDYDDDLLDRCRDALFAAVEPRKPDA